METRELEHELLAAERALPCDHGGDVRRHRRGRRPGPDHVRQSRGDDDLRLDARRAARAAVHDLPARAVPQRLADATRALLEHRRGDAARAHDRGARRAPERRGVRDGGVARLVGARPAARVHGDHARRRRAQRDAARARALTRPLPRGRRQPAERHRRAVRHRRAAAADGRRAHGGARAAQRGVRRPEVGEALAPPGGEIIEPHVRAALAGEEREFEIDGPDALLRGPRRAAARRGRPHDRRGSGGARRERAARGAPQPRGAGARARALQRRAGRVRQRRLARPRPSRCARSPATCSCCGAASATS